MTTDIFQGITFSDVKSRRNAELAIEHLTHTSDRNRGFLVIGGPGSGKTMLARMIARQVRTIVCASSPSSERGFVTAIKDAHARAARVVVFDDLPCRRRLKSEALFDLIRGDGPLTTANIFLLGHALRLAPNLEKRFRVIRLTGRADAAQFAHMFDRATVAAVVGEETEEQVDHVRGRNLTTAWRHFSRGTFATNNAKGFGMPEGADVHWDGNQIALMHGELSEAHEGIRKDLMDAHLPHRKAVEVELADVVIRIMNYGTERKLDIAGAIVEKAAFNKTRPHMHGAGKKF